MITRSLIAICFATALSAEPLPEMPVWPEGLPKKPAETLTDERIAQLRNNNTEERIAVVTEPTLTVYPAPADTANGAAVVVCPGGGYNILAWPKEGLEIAEWFNSFGVTAAVLKYRVPRRYPEEFWVPPLQDAQRAIRMVRHNAEDWNIDPERVGVLGFSAGGHLTVMTGTQWDEATYEPKGIIDGLSCRPDFIMPIYPAYLANEDRFEPLDRVIEITPETPPTFIAVTDDDKLRGVNAAQLYIQLNQAGVRSELHVYSVGGHGYGIRPSDNPVSTWHRRCEEWMRIEGFLSNRP